MLYYLDHMKGQGLRYKGPIYRPPSEAYSLLVQATIGCPHNKCTFCTVYKKGPKFQIRPVNEIKEDLLWAKENINDFNTVFFPSGNTVIMKTDDLVDIFSFTNSLFPKLKRITVYGSAQYIVKKILDDWKKIANAGLSRAGKSNNIVTKKVTIGRNNILSKLSFRASLIFSYFLP